MWWWSRGTIDVFRFSCKDPSTSLNRWYTYTTNFCVGPNYLSLHFHGTSMEKSFAKWFFVEAMTPKDLGERHTLHHLHCLLHHNKKSSYIWRHKTLTLENVEEPSFIVNITKQWTSHCLRTLAKDHDGTEIVFPRWSWTPLRRKMRKYPSL